MGMLFYEKWPLEVCSNGIYFRGDLAHITEGGGIVFNPEVPLSEEQKEKISAFVEEAKEKGKEY